MKALSIKNPWAWAIAEGHKTIETRAWNTDYRGDLLIVSSKLPDKTAIKFLKDTFDTFRFIEQSMMKYGQAIAIAKLVDCRLMTKADQDAALCNIYPNAHSWVLEDVRKIDPFPVTGQLKLYDVDIALCSCGMPGKERIDNGLKAGVHCDPCWNKLVEDCRKRSW